MGCMNACVLERAIRSLDQGSYEIQRNKNLTMNISNTFYFLLESCFTVLPGLGLSSQSSCLSLTDSCDYKHEQPHPELDNTFLRYVKKNYM
jgi:hypothetical protein